MKLKKRNRNLQTLRRCKPYYPENFSRYLGKEAPEVVHAIGNLAVLENPITALFCSQRCPGELILKTYDLIKELRSNGGTIISGFHSPVEKDCLTILLRGTQPIVICPARSIDNMRIPREWHQHLDNGRILILSPFSSKQYYISAQKSVYRNRFVAALSNEVIIIHAAPHSKTMTLSKEILSWQIPIHTFNQDDNQQLIELGAQSLTTQ
jgi:predicted Rossmann fold nucleotide-binding protein DprA/Smf involved in DNA uptake